MQPLRIDGSRLILLLIGVCLGMTLVATIALWPQWSPLMRVLVLVADALWMVGASRLVLSEIEGDSHVTGSDAEAVGGGPEGR